MEKLDKVIRAMEMHEGADGREVSCVGCPYEEYEEYCLTVLHKDTLDVIKALSAETQDQRKDIEVQGEIILELNRDMKAMRKAMNGQSEYAYLGGDLISRAALAERMEDVDWYSTNDSGVLSSGAANEESAYVRYADVVAVIEGALAVESAPVARWITTGDGKWNNWCCCSNCKTAGSPSWKRCPVCEAKMDGGVENV